MALSVSKGFVGRAGGRRGGGAMAPSGGTRRTGLLGGHKALCLIATRTLSRSKTQRQDDDRDKKFLGWTGRKGGGGVLHGDPIEHRETLHPAIASIYRAKCNLYMQTIKGYTFADDFGRSKRSAIIRQRTRT